MNVKDAFDERRLLPQTVLDTLSWLDAREANENPAASRYERLLRLFTKAPKAFFRFDVDASLPAAVRMAGLAQIGGVHATFFLMPRTPLYNLFSREGDDAISTILLAGHKVGLHCDFRGGDAETVVARDRALLDVGYPGVFGDAVSFHMPPAEVLWRRFSTFTNAYAPEWEGRYISDSRRSWDDAKAARVNDTMQIALHPVWWC